MTRFSEVLTLFESHGWKLHRIVGTLRVFVKHQGPPDEPYVIQVFESTKVRTDDFERARRYLEETT